MTDLVVPHLGFRPRDYQRRCWDALLKDNVKRAALCWHRRAGKDLLMLNIAQVFMLERSCLVWHLLPQFNQARRVVWNGMTSEGNGFLDYFHPELIERRRDDQMLIQFKKEHGGSIYQCVGSDQPDKLMGANPALVIFSEYALADPQCWDYIRPILNENDGVAAFISTPRGYNHFYDVMAQARESEKWFSETLTVRETKRSNGEPVVTDEMIEEDRRSGMPDELIRQEYYCDFSAPLTGAYWGRELDEADREGRIGDVVWRREYPVHTAWDLGMRDATAIWFYQVVDGYVHWIDYYASSGEGLEHYAKVLQTKPYVYKEHWAPHDIRVRELGSGVSRWQTAADLGVFFRVVPRLSVDEGVQAARLVIPRSRFDKEKCADGIKGLRHYRKEWDTHNRLWSAKPVHDWTEHPASAFRYGCLTVPRGRVKVRDPIVWNMEETFDQALERSDALVKERRSADQVQWKGI
jgi:hypothetical protein